MCAHYLTVKNRRKLSFKLVKVLNNCIRTEVVKLVSNSRLTVMYICHCNLVQTHNCLWISISYCVRSLWIYLRYDPDFI